MVRVVLRAKDVAKTFEIKNPNPGTIAMTQFIVLLASISKDAVIIITDEANWQKMKGAQ